MMQKTFLKTIFVFESELSDPIKDSKDNVKMKHLRESKEMKPSSSVQRNKL